MSRVGAGMVVLVLVAIGVFWVKAVGHVPAAVPASMSMPVFTGPSKPSKRLVTSPPSREGTAAAFPKQEDQRGQIIITPVAQPANAAKAGARSALLGFGRGVSGSPK